MLRFDKPINFSPFLKSNLLVNSFINTYGSEVLLFSEHINTVIKSITQFLLTDTKGNQFV